MLKFNPNPLFPEQPLFEIGSEAEIPRSARYTLYCDGQKQTVYHTDSFDYAVVEKEDKIEVMRFAGEWRFRCPSRWSGR